MADVEEPFFGDFSVTTLEQWGLDEGDIAEVTFSYLNIISAIFQQYIYIYIYIYENINTTSSISIRLLYAYK